MESIEPFSEGFVLALAPEFILVIGLFTLMIAPNVGNATFRVPLTQIRLPWFFGGKRGLLSSDPRLPGLFATVFFTLAFGLATVSFIGGMNKTLIVTSGGSTMLQIDEFSRMFELIFYGGPCSGERSLCRTVYLPPPEPTAQPLVCTTIAGRSTSTSSC